MNILKSFMRLVLKTLLAPVSLLLLLTKGVLCLATKIVELPLGLFIWLMIFIIGFCVFNHLWRDFDVGWIDGTYQSDLRICPHLISTSFLPEYHLVST